MTVFDGQDIAPMLCKTAPLVRYGFLGGVRVKMTIDTDGIARKIYPHSQYCTPLENPETFTDWQLSGGGIY